MLWDLQNLSYLKLNIFLGADCISDQEYDRSSVQGVLPGRTGAEELLFTSNELAELDAALDLWAGDL